MAGLHQVFSFSRQVQDAVDEINCLKQKEHNCCEWETEGYHFHFSQTENKTEPAQIWLNQGIAGYNELGFSLGTGFPAEAEEDLNQEGLFVYKR